MPVLEEDSKLFHDRSWWSEKHAWHDVMLAYDMAEVATPSFLEDCLGEGIVSEHRGAERDAQDLSGRRSSLISGEEPKG